MLAQADVNPWQFNLHPEVLALVALIIGLGWYATHVIGPKVVPADQPIVTRGQKLSFWSATALLLVAAGWPIHDIAEQYLFSVHMTQHLLITFMVPPLFLMAIPEWLARLVILDGGLSSKILQFFTKPVVAGLIFNALIALTHFSGIVNETVENGPFHFAMHLLIFTSALLMWTPVVGPMPEQRLSLPGQMVYLFLMSIMPTIPAAWLTFAEGTVYTAYESDFDLWGINVRDDQQYAGLIMKLVGGFYLWGLIITKFFMWAQVHERENERPAYVRPDLTYAEVESAFDEAGEPSVEATPDNSR
jgi:putative membrane protein